MKEIHLDQGTQDWLNWRAGHAFVDVFGTPHVALDGPRITATAASVCGGDSPFATPHQLYNEALGIKKREPVTEAMRRGNELEPKARQLYMELVGEDYEAICVESTVKPWIAASLDGVNLLRTRGVEIKCPISQRIHDMAMLGEVPSYYADQIQWQMLATDNQITEVDFFSYAPHFGTAAPITVKCDPERQAVLLEQSELLRIAIITRIPLCGNDFVAAARRYVVLNHRLKEIDSQVEAAKAELKKIANGKPMQGGGVNVTVSKGEGRISWEELAMEVMGTADMSADDIVAMQQKHKKAPTKATITVKESAEAESVYQQYLAEQAIKETRGIVVVSESDVQKDDQPAPIW